VLAESDQVCQIDADNDIIKIVMQLSLKNTDNGTNSILFRIVMQQFCYLQYILNSFCSKLTTVGHPTKNSSHSPGAPQSMTLLSACSPCTFIGIYNAVAVQ
jgi:hypothetical protein